MKRRLMLVRALMNNPEIIMLDEPTTGLDPASRRSVWEKMNDLKFNNTTLLLTTHYIEEAERLCDRVAIMDRGSIVIIDTPRMLMATYGGNLEDVYLKLTGGGAMKARHIASVLHRHLTVYTKLYLSSIALNLPNRSCIWLHSASDWEPLFRDRGHAVPELYRARHHCVICHIWGRLRMYVWNVCEDVFFSGPLMRFSQPRFP